MRAPEPDHQDRPAGLRTIIAYKVIKAPIMAAIALFLTFAPADATKVGVHLAHELAGGGAILRRIAGWLLVHVTMSVVQRAAVVAWGDALSTSLEAYLLWRDKPWGEWLVVAGLSLGVVAEIVSLEHRVTALKLVVLAINVAVVVYLARRRLLAARAHRRPSLA